MRESVEEMIWEPLRGPGSLKAPGVAAHTQTDVSGFV